MEHKDCLELMSFAFTIQRGENEGKYLQEMNPKYQAEIQKASDEIIKVRESVKQ